MMTAEVVVQDCGISMSSACSRKVSSTAAPTRMLLAFMEDPSTYCAGGDPLPFPAACGSSTHVDPLLSIYEADESLCSFCSLDATLDYISPGISNVAPLSVPLRSMHNSSLGSSTLRWRVCTTADGSLVSR